MSFALRSGVLIALTLLPIDMATAKPTDKSIVEVLLHIATHSCMVDDGHGHKIEPQGDYVYEPEVLSHGQEQLILRRLEAANKELNESLTDVLDKKGVIPNVLNTYKDNEVMTLKPVLQFKCKWKGSVSHLTSQQVIGMETLIRMAWYVHLMQMGEPSNAYLYGADATPTLQKILSQLRQATCSLQYLLSNVDIKSGIRNVEISPSFPWDMSDLREDDRRILMGLTLTDILTFVKGMTMSLEKVEWEIDQVL